METELNKESNKSLDTSQPGREEEVIVNNTGQAKDGKVNSKLFINKNEGDGARTFKEGLQDNSNTENN